MPPLRGLERTLQLLRKSPNRAATKVLLASLCAPSEPARLGALRALATRSESSAQDELLAALSDAPTDVRDAANDPQIAKRLRMSVVNALEGSDPTLVKRACRYAVDAELLVVIPTLIEQSTDPEQSYHVGLSTAALKLCRVMAHRLQNKEPSAAAGGTDPAFYRTTTLQRLIEAADKFAEHQRLELVEALLLVTTRDNSRLLQMLRTDGHACQQALTETLTKSPSFGALDLLSNALIDNDSPKRLVKIACQRTDKPFLSRLADNLGYPLGARAREKASAIKSFAWMKPEQREVVLSLTSSQQSALVALASATAGTVRDRLGFVKFVLQRGADKGRVAACHLLREYKSPQVSILLQAALEDQSPGVVAAAARQLRSQKTSAADVVLIGLLDHPAEEVRRAAQDELHELNLAAYRKLYSKLTEASRRIAGRLVARADPDAKGQLEAELRHPTVRQRLDSLAMIDSMGLADELNESLAEALSDKDVGVRVEAARLLGVTTSVTSTVYSALTQAAEDSNQAVRTAVQKSLDAIQSLDLAEDLIAHLQDEFPAGDADQEEDE